MTIILGIIVSIIIFSVIVLIHEYGHFKTARIFGVRVEEFGLGIPPRAKKLFKDKKGTLFSLNWLPLGGFVKLKGEGVIFGDFYDGTGKKLKDNEVINFVENKKDIYDKKGQKIPEKDSLQIAELLKSNKDPDSLVNIHPIKQSIVILAGVFMNFLLAVVIFSILFMIGVKPVGINNKIDTDLNLRLIPTEEQAFDIGLLTQKTGVYLYPIEGSIAEESGIKEGDFLKKVDGVIISDYEEVKSIISSNASKKLNFEIIRGLELGKLEEEGEVFSINIIPSEEGLIGSYLVPNVILDENFRYRYGPIEALKEGSKETYGQVILTFKALGMLVKKITWPETKEERQEAIDSVSGPIGVVDLISDSMERGILFLIIIGAIISINLGVFNLLPIPALDGGRFLFITVNSIVKKVFGFKIIGDKIEGIIHITFFAILIGLSILIAYNDINKIIGN